MSAGCQSLPVPAHRLRSAAAMAIRQLFPGLRHPYGFYVVCTAVFCERWAAAMLGSSVVLMLCERYGYAKGDALRFAGLMNAASYLATLPGGLAVDHSLSSHRTFGAGLALLALGYAVLTLSAPSVLLAAFLLLALGHALFKPSTQALITRLYAQNDAGLDAAQISLYLAGNAGGAVGAGITGLFMRNHAFSAACAVAATVTLAGRIAVALRMDSLWLRQPGRPVMPAAVSEMAYLPAWQRAKSIGGLTLAFLLYTVGFGQVEGALFLWAQDRTERFLFGFEVPAAWFVGLPALLVLVLAPVQLVLLPKIKRRIDTQRMMALGLVAVAMAFVILLPPAFLSDGHRVSMAWLSASMTLLVLGELLVAPLGQSMILRLSPPRFVGLMVGVWYVSGALGFWLAGEIGALWVQGAKK